MVDVGERETVICGGAVIVTDAEADLVVSATEVAVTVTVAGLGTADGAVYRPEDVIVPTVALPPSVPFTDQVTDVLDAFETVAANCRVSLVCTYAEVGKMEIVMFDGAVTVTCAEPEVPPPDPTQESVYVSVPTCVGVTDFVPLVGSDPDQSLSAGNAAAEHEFAFALDQVTAVDWFWTTELGFAEIVTVGAGGGCETLPPALPPQPACHAAARHTATAFNIRRFIAFLRSR